MSTPHVPCNIIDDFYQFERISNIIRFCTITCECMRILCSQVYTLMTQGILWYSLHFYYLSWIFFIFILTSSPIPYSDALCSTLLYSVLLFYLLFFFSIWLTGPFMSFMNDPEIQTILHVRGYNVPGLNFYPERDGETLESFTVNLIFSSILFYFLVFPFCFVLSLIVFIWLFFLFGVLSFIPLCFIFRPRSSLVIYLASLLPPPTLPLSFLLRQYLSHSSFHTTLLFSSPTILFCFLLLQYLTLYSSTIPYSFHLLQYLTLFLSFSFSTHLSFYLSFSCSYLRPSPS